MKEQTYRPPALSSARASRLPTQTRRRSPLHPWATSQLYPHHPTQLRRHQGA